MAYCRRKGGDFSHIFWRPLLLLLLSGSCQVLHAQCSTIDRTCTKLVFCGRIIKCLIFSLYPLSQQRPGGISAIKPLLMYVDGGPSIRVNDTHAMKSPPLLPTLSTCAFIHRFLLRALNNLSPHRPFNTLSSYDDVGKRLKISLQFLFKKDPPFGVCACVLYLVHSI